MGINAKFEGKNDIKVDGLKISGNAEHVHRNRVLHHGTLLFASSMKMLKSSIRTDKSSYVTRGVDSNPASVMNLSDKLKIFSDITEFREGMMHYFSATIPNLEMYNLSQREIEEAASLAETKYRSWEWNFAYGPEYIFRNAFLYEDEIYCCILNIRNGVVMKCTIDGSGKLMSVAEKLCGCRHMVPDFSEVFEKENITISGEEIFNFF
jgi:lipoate---protein ligase